MTHMDKALKAYEAGCDEATRARLEFFAGLHRLQQEWANRVTDAGAYEPPAVGQIEAWYWAFEPTLSHAPVAIDAELFAQALEAIAGHIVAGAGLEEKTAEALAAVDWKEFCNQADLELAGRDPAMFVEGCLANVDAIGVGADVPVSLFALALRFALRAWLQPAAEAIMPLAPKDRIHHDCPLDCPVCGTPSAASFVGESAASDGKGRMQYCAACGAQWDFERIRCGVCGTQNQRKLHYFNLEGDDAHRIQSCDECGQYQRVTFQEDIPGALCMEVEDVVMARLDQVALDPRFRKEA